MNKILIILITIIIVLCGILGVTYKRMTVHKADSIRHEQNYTQSQKDVQRIQLSYREFKDQKSNKIDSLLHELNIKPKQIESIITIRTTYTNTDTIFVPLTQTNVNSFEFIERIDCTEIEGSIITGLTNKPELSITNLSHNDEIDYVAYWKRRQWRLLGIKTRLFGKKLGELKVVSKCGNINVHQIDIIKKK